MKDHYTAVIYLSTTGVVTVLESNAPPWLTDALKEDFSKRERGSGLHLSFAKSIGNEIKVITRGANNSGASDEMWTIGRHPADIFDTNVKNRPPPPPYDPALGVRGYSIIMTFDEALELIQQQTTGTVA